MQYTDIQGWFDFEAIYDAAVVDHPAGVFVEVGAWKGKSTAYLAARIQNLPIRFFAVDTWRGSDGTDALSDQFTVPLLVPYGGDVFDHFLDNMEGCGVAHSVVPLRMRSAQAAKLFADNSIDFCFLDASHDYHSVMADLKTWHPKVKRGGTIGGHDFIEFWPGVVNAVHEFFADKGSFDVLGCSWRSRKP